MKILSCRLKFLTSVALYRFLASYAALSINKDSTASCTSSSSIGLTASSKSCEKNKLKKNKEIDCCNVSARKGSKNQNINDTIIRFIFSSFSLGESPARDLQITAHR